MGYTPGKIEVVVSGILEGQSARKSLKWGDANRSQSYLLLENATLEQLLNKSKAGDPISVRGEHIVYKGKPYLWLNPELNLEKKAEEKEKEISFEGKFVKSEGQLLLQIASEKEKEKGNSAESYIALENAEREQIESFLDGKNEKKAWKVSGSTSRYNGKNYLLIRKYQIEK